MGKLEDLQAADAREDAKIDALIQAYKDQKQLITDLQAQVAAGADPTKLQELIDAADAKTAAMDAALGITPEVPPANPA